MKYFPGTALGEGIVLQVQGAGPDDCPVQHHEALAAALHTCGIALHKIAHCRVERQ